MELSEGSVWGRKGLQQSTRAEIPPFKAEIFSRGPGLCGWENGCDSGTAQSATLEAGLPRLYPKRGERHPQTKWLLIAMKPPCTEAVYP